MVEKDFRLIEPHTCIGKEDFIKLLRLCLNEANYFVYENQFYRQHRGMFMGSSLAPILVERVVEYIVEVSLEELGIQHDFWFTYVDDHLTSIKREDIQTLLDKLNSFDPLVQFTVEIQKDDKSIEFLDTTVYNCGNKIKTKWFHKPIASNRLLNYYSKHPRNMIMNVATGFIKRVLTISHSLFHREDKATIETILKKNNFPVKIIRQLISKVNGSAVRTNQSHMVSYPFIDLTNHSIHLNESATVTQNVNISVDNANRSIGNLTSAIKPKLFAGMTYVPVISEKIADTIKRKAPELNIAPRPIKKVGDIFTGLKQKLTIDQESCVVYRIQCRTCSKFYIGETSWCLVDRSITHKNDIKYMNNKAGNSKKTALVKHVFDTGPNHHVFDFDRKEILQRVRKKGLLKIHEANQIVLHGDKALNFKSDAAHITPVFYNIIKNNAKHPNVNPELPISYGSDSTSALTSVADNNDNQIVNVNNTNRNTRTRYNLRNRN